MPKKTILNVDSLCKTFTPRSLVIRQESTQPFVAVKSVSFAIQQGEIVGLLGPNGSGKTTIMQMLLGTLSPTSGNISYFGKDFISHRSEILQDIGFASSYLKLAPRLTVHENLDIFGRLYGLSSKERPYTIEKFLRLLDAWDIRNKEVAVLSAGQTTRVMLAKAFLTNPKIVLLDEPTASLDPEISHEIRQFLLKQQCEQDMTILIASHNMDEIHQLCNRALVLKNGAVIANDTPLALASSIATARIKLAINNGIEQAVLYAQQHALPHSVDQATLSIQIDEDKVGPLLMNLALSNISYAHISIEKPTLEDYFLHVADILPKGSAL